MSENGESQYISTDKDGNVKIEQDGYIDKENIDQFKFIFGDPQEITEGVADKNQKNKQPVSYTKRGRSAYSPNTIHYPDNTTSSKMVLMDCIVQYTSALEAPNHKYGKNFVIIGLPEAYIDKITSDAKEHRGINLDVKPNTSLLNGHYWLRCNLDKLAKKDTHILVEANGGTTIEMDLDKLLTEFKSSVSAFIVFTLSASMNNNNMDEELDLKDGQYYITMKPTELYATSDSEIQGPVLQDTNNRRNEGAQMSGQMFASGKLAEFAMKRLKISSK